MKKFFRLTLAIPVLLSFSVAAQSYKNLVLEGAGVRGVAYVGSIKLLEEKNLLQDIEKVGGTSAGAIAALAIALGYNSKEIETLIYDTKLQNFNDGRFFFIGGISRLNRNYGWYRGNAFTKWLGMVILLKTGNADITFQELHDRHFKDLYVTGTSLNNQKLIVFSYETYPTMKVKDAVRISMSIPLYFEAVLIDSAGRTFSKNKFASNFDIMVDGGLTGNFPITIFDSTNTNGVKVPNLSTLGIRIDTPEQIHNDSIHGGLASIPIDRFRSYISAYYNYVIENLNRSLLSKEDWDRTVSISSGNIGPKIRRLSMKEKEILINNGYSAMERFLTKSGQ